MREIKFRAWDKETKRMFDNWNCIFSITCSGNVVVSKGFEIQQFTGLKDKNGKEIYEGDILKDDWDTFYEVYWASGIGQWRMKCGEEYFDFDGTTPDGIIPEKFEITGNIYENPELLSSPNLKYKEDKDGK